MNDDVKLKILAARIHKARKDIEEARKIFPKSMLDDALSVGSSQTKTLKAWSTDKKDKEPLIRTHPYMNSRFPFLATVNDELKKLKTLDPTLIAKKRNPKGELTEIDLEDARFKGKVRVSIDAPKIWLSNGTACDNDTLESIYYLLSSEIRKVRNHSGCNFDNITTISSNMTRTWVQTQEPTINVLGKTSAFYQATLEGDTNALGLSRSDKKHVDDILTKLAPKVTDPEDLIRMIRNLSDPKFKYAPVNDVHNIAAIEMRHCLESDSWHINPEGLPSTINEESKILRITCGHLIYISLFSGAFPLETLKDLMRKTFIGNESIEYILREKIAYQEMLIAVCQASLGKPIPQFRQLQGVTFVLSSYKREYDNLREEERLEMEKQTSPIVKVVSYSEKTYNQYDSFWENKMREFKVRRGFSEHNIRYVTTSAVLTILNGKIMNMTVLSKSKNDIIHLIACTLTFFNLYEEEKLDHIKLEKKQSLSSALIHQLKDYRKWPFEPRTYEPVRLDEFLLKDIPAFKNLILLDSEATGFTTEPIKCKVDPDTLQIEMLLGPDDIESYEKVLISDRSIRESASNLVQSVPNLPKTVFSIHPVLIHRMGSDQLLIRLMLEVFVKWMKADNLSSAEIWEVDRVTLENLGPVYEFSNSEARIMGELLKKLKQKVLKTIKEKFSIAFLEVMLANLHNEHLHGFNSKLKVRTSDSGITLIHKQLSATIPGWNSGKVTLSPGLDLMVTGAPIYNIKTRQFLINSSYFEFPMLEECKEQTEHVSKKGVPTGALTGLIGEHVMFHGKCYVVTGKTEDKTINDLFSETEMNQQIIRNVLVPDMGSDSESDNFEEELDVDDY